MNLQDINSSYGLDTEAIASYVLSRRTDDGGFAFSPSLPSSLPETFYALYILNYIGVEIEGKAIKFLKDRISSALAI